MAAKNFAGQLDANELADMMDRRPPAPRPRPPREEAPPLPRPTPPPAKAKKEKGEKPRAPQFSLSLRKELRQQLDRLAYDARMTMRAFVLDALKAKGLKVRDDDLTDLRKR